MRLSLICALLGALTAGACSQGSNEPGGGTTLGRGSDKVDGLMGGVTSPGGMNPNKQPPPAGAALHGDSGSQSNRADPGGSGTGTGGNPGGTTGGNAPGGE